MATIRFITVGTLKEDYLRAAVSEYEKRLSGFCRVESVNLKEAKLPNDPSDAEIKKALAEEAKAILSAAPDRSYKIAMCVEGKQFSSEELSKKISEACDMKGRIALVIGSSHGMSMAVKDACDLKLSFSKMTFPHQLMRVMVFEALYRSFTIIANKSYHK